LQEFRRREEAKERADEEFKVRCDAFENWKENFCSKLAVRVKRCKLLLDHARHILIFLTLAEARVAEEKEEMKKKQEFLDLEEAEMITELCKLRKGSSKSALEGSISSQKRILKPIQS